MKRDGNKNFELRKSVRLPVSLPVRFRLFDIHTYKASSTPIHGQLRNISVKGLCLETNTTKVNNRNIFISCLEDDNQLELEIKLPNINHPLCLRGNVIWFNSLPPDSTYHFFAGINIAEVSESNRNLWSEYVKEHKERWYKVWTKISFKIK